MQTRLPGCPKRGSLSLASYLVRNPTLGPSLEKKPETPRHPEMRAFVSPMAYSTIPIPLSKLHRRSGSLRPLCGLQQIPVSSTEENGGLCFHPRRALTPWLSLECNPEICVAPSEEHWLLDTSLDEVYLPCSHSRAIPSFPSQLEPKIALPWADTRGILNSPS